MMIKSIASAPEFLRACLCAAVAWLLLAWPAQAQVTDFLEPDQAFRVTVEPRDGGRVGVEWQIARGYYLYRDRMKVTAVPSSVPVAIDVPRGIPKQDRNFGMVEVYHDQVRLEVNAPGATALHLVWQGCAEAGLCYPPQEQTVTLAGPSMPAASTASAPLASLIGPQPVLPGIGGPSAKAAVPRPDSGGAAEDGAAFAARTSEARAAPGGAATESSVAAALQSRLLLWTVPLFLVLGVGFAFTPCVLPMLPIVSGIVVGSQAQPRRAFALSLAFVLAMAAVYALLGTGAALAGGSLQSVLQNPMAIAAAAALFAAMSLSMFGWYELQIPGFLRDRLSVASPRGGGLAGAAAMGALSALLVSPCMTAPLAGTLLYIAQTGKVGQGAALLFALGIGMGLPMLAISTLGARVLPRPGPWMNRVKGAFGFALLATAVAMLQRVLPASAAVLLWGAWLAAVALTLWSLPMGTGAHVMARSAALVAGLWGAAMVLGASAGATDPLRPLAPLAQRQAGPSGTDLQAALFETVTDPQVLLARLEAARSSGRPALVDFSADWCTSCKTIDREVFDDPQVRQALTGAVRLRADVTVDDPRQQGLMRRYQIMGPPTVMLFDAHGRERREDRLVGEFTAADLLQRLRSAGRAS